MSKDGQVAAAKQDLARRLGIPEDQITLKSVQEKDWPDASLGVSEPGQFHAQMLVFGYIIKLEATGKTYTDHSDDRSRVVRAS